MKNLKEKLIGILANVVLITFTSIFIYYLAFYVIDFKILFSN